MTTAKSITDIIPKAQSSIVAPQNIGKENAIVSWSRRSLETALAKSTPAEASYFAANPDEAFETNYPPLGAIRSSLGTNQARAWIFDQLVALYVQSGTDNPNARNSLGNVASALVERFASYKLTELMHFFCGYAAGQYGKSYQFNVRDIGVGFSEWQKERVNILNRLEIERASKKRSEDYEKSRKNAVTYEAYQSASTILVNLNIPDEELRKKITYHLHGIAEGNIVTAHCPKGPLFTRLLELCQEGKLNFE